MSTFYEFYINETKYTPINLGEIDIDTTRDRQSGSYQYVKSLSSKVKFSNDDGAYNYILKHGECQEVVLLIKEYCSDFPDGIVIYNGSFTRRDCFFDPAKSIVEVSTKENSLYQCVLDNYDRKFNMLEASNVVSSTYATDVSEYEYRVRGGVQVFKLPFFGDFIENSFGSSPIFGITLFVREVTTTYCQAGKPQSPPQGAFAQWELLVNNCEGKGVSTWYRKPNSFQPALVDNINFAVTGCVGVFCIPPPPPVTAANEVWVLMDTGTVAVPAGNLGFWIDENSISKNLVEINNGRLLPEVINLGLNKYKGCEALDVQSQLLFNPVNPVTGVSPSPTYQAQLHAIDDVKDPDADLPGTVENVTLKDLMSGIIEGKYNAFWRVNEGTKRFIIEHINDLNNQGVIDLTAIDDGIWTELKDKYGYNNSDVPKAEQFPSLDTSIDFTGVDIVYENKCSSGVKSFETDKVYTEVERIVLDPDTYPNDGIVLITPDSLAPFGTLDDDGNPIGTRGTTGAITGDYRPNAPMAMANLQNDYWGYYRPFGSGNMNFKDVAFDKVKPVKDLEEITIPICCFFSFDPTSAFIGNDFDNGQLVSSSYNLGTKTMKLKIEY